MSAMHLACPWRGPLVAAAESGTTQGNRQAAAWLYSGILAGALVATGTVQLVGAQIGDATNRANAFDNNFTTYASGVDKWVGLDAGTAVVVRAMEFAARRGDDAMPSELAYENRTIGAKFQASSTVGFTSDVTDVDTIPSPLPHPQSYRWNTRTMVSPPTKQYWRWKSSPGVSIDLAGIRFLADAGPSSAQPCQPTISPWGGRYPTGSRTVTLACATTSALLYYTTDGSTPDNTKTLYSSPFVLSIGGSGTTLKAVAYDASLGTTYSVVSTSTFLPWGYTPNDDWTDDHGDLIEAHAGGVMTGAGGVPLLVDGYYWWYGMNGNRYSYNGFFDGLGADGVTLYKSTDLLNWIRVGHILDNTTGFAHVERPHVIYNAATSLYVLWAHLTTLHDSTDRAGVATASSPAGPWTWVTTSLNPDGFGFLDCSLFLDDDGLAYVVYNVASTMYVSKLASNFQSTTGNYVTFVTSGLEAPCICKDIDGTYRLFCAIALYYDSSLQFSVGAYTATTPLGTWTGPPASSTFPPFPNGPVGGDDYNAQPTCAFRVGSTIVLMMDWWLKTAHDQSRYVWLPVVAGVGTTPTSWNLSAESRRVVRAVLFSGRA
jgi:hypothetical protein